MAHEFRTPEEAAEALRKQSAEVAALRGQVDAQKKAMADLQDIVRAQAEAGAPREEFASSERGLNDYLVRADGDVTGIRVKGQIDPRTREYVPGLLDDEVTHGEWHRDFKHAVGVRNWVRSHRRSGSSPAADARIERLMQRAPDPIRRAFDGGTGTGAEWLPDGYVPQLEEALRHVSGGVASLFDTVPMSEASLVYPFLSRGLTPYVKGKYSGGDDKAQYKASSLDTAQRTRTATGFAVRLVVDEDASEDSLISTMPLAQRELVAALRDGLDDAIINGDTNATHQDTLSAWNPRNRWDPDQIGDADDHRRAILGLRAFALDASSSLDLSTVSYANLIALRSGLDAPHGTRGSLVMIVSDEAYMKLLTLDEVKTVDKYGPQATILTGEVAQVAGVPILVSGFMDRELNASGVFDDTTKTKTGVLLVNRDRFAIGVRRAGRVEMDKDITRGIFQTVSTWRGTFWSQDTTSVKNVNYGYNITSA